MSGVENTTMLVCQGCGAEVSDIDGPTHKYVVAAPGCWLLFSEVVGREYGEFGYPEVRRLTVDASRCSTPATLSMIAASDSPWQFICAACTCI